MNRMKKNFLKWMALSLILIISACSENDPAPQVIESEIDDATAEAYVDYAEDDVNEMVIDLMDDIRLGEAGGQAANGNNRFRPFVGKISCADISINLDEKSITLDFGEGCESADGVTRSGIIMISFTDARHVAGAVITTTFENYQVNDISIEGTRTLTNISDGTERQRAFEITIENGKVVFPDDSYRTFSGTRTRIWDFDETSREVTLTVTGEKSGINRNSEEFVNTITEALVFKNSCRRVGTKVAVSGERSISRAASTYTINYGEGECDNEVTVTLPNGDVIEVIIEGRRG